jgi:hypothetical protein
LIKQWGNHDFKFKLKPQGGSESQKAGSQQLQKSLFQASLLLAEAEEPNNSGFPVPIKCTWLRITDDKETLISDISSNVYQLSARDLGSVIKVVAEPLDPDFKGKAFAQFGPVQLDVSARQHLEQILGAGGSQFPISVILNDGGSGFEIKEDSQEATLYINSHLLKIQLKDRQ